MQAKFTAAHAACLRRFDAASAHDSDGYATASVWLIAMTQATRPDARAAVAEMRRLAQHPAIAQAMAAGQVSRSYALAITELTRKLPAQLRAQHDALQLGCELLIRAKMVPDRADADTQVITHIGLSQLRDTPGASAAEQAWLAGRAGEPGYLTGKDAQTAACDAVTVPVVTGHAGMTVIDRIIDLALTACTHGHDTDRDRPGGLPAGAHAALRHAIARLAIGFVSYADPAARSCAATTRPPCAPAEPGSR